ncbi:MAG: aminotransferase class IV [Verrucomicrobiota bacterium]
MNVVCLNGEFLPAEEARVSIFDRSFLYGDGLFETLRVYGGHPFAWTEHLDRLERSAGWMGLRMPTTRDILRSTSLELLRRNGQSEALLRIQISRGQGRRGYSPRGAESPVWVVTTHPATPQDPDRPTRWRLATASLRLAVSDPLNQRKSSSKLLQVLARAEAESQGSDEALLLDTAGEVVEGSSSNVFWIAGRRLLTPPVGSGALPGITRDAVLRIAPELGFIPDESRCTPEDLRAADGVFLTLSSLELVTATALDGTALRESPGTRVLHEAYQRRTRSGPH